MWKATETAHGQHQAVDQDVEGHGTSTWTTSSSGPRCGRPRKQHMDNIKQWTKMWKATETAHGQHQAVDQDVEGHGNSTWTTSSSGPRCGRPRKQHMDNIKQWTKMWKATETAHGQHQAVDQDVEGHGNSTWITSSSGPRCGRPRKQHMDNIKQWTKMWKATETAHG